jgi:predicted GIY-YIG superfamily endonuclease
MNKLDEYRSKNKYGDIRIEDLKGDLNLCYYLEENLHFLLIKHKIDYMKCLVGFTKYNGKYKPQFKGLVCSIEDKEVIDKIIIDNETSVKNTIRKKEKVIRIKKQNKELKEINTDPAYVYVLKLEDNKYWIGWTQDPTKRISKCFNGFGPVFTRLNKPIQVELILKIENQEEAWKIVNGLVKEYMEKYGFNNVRGGSYSITLDLYEIPKLDSLTPEHKVIIEESNITNSFSF